MMGLGSYKTSARERRSRRPDRGVEDEDAHVQVRFAKVGNQLDRFRAEGAWDRVMQEIFEITPVGGAMTPNEILPELRSVTIRKAALH